MLNKLKSLKLKLLFILVPGTILALLFTFLIMLHQAKVQFDVKLDEKMAHLGTYADLLADPLWNLNSERVETIITSILLDQDITDVKIHDEGNHLLHQKSSTEFDVPQARQLIFAIVYKNAHITQQVGTITITLGNQTLQKDKTQFVLSGLFSLVLTLFTLLIGTWLTFSKLIDKPLKALIEAIRNSKKDKMFTTVPHQSHDELGVIISAFNEMQISLESNHKKITKSKQHLQHLYHSTPSLLFSFDQDGVIQDASDYFLDKLYYKQEEIIGRHLDNLITGKDKHHNVQKITQALWAEGRLIEYPLQFVCGNNEQIEVLINATLSEHDLFPGALAVFTDVTGLNQAKRKLEHQANTDQLSGISNRYHFQNYLEQLTDPQQNDDKSFALLFIDLDHFKSVNDTYGHHTGDQLLRLVSNRIQSAIRPQDKIARLGGDEFAVILENINSESTALQISQRIIHKMESGFTLQESNIYITASIGIAIYPEDCKTPAKLLQFADLAMYNAKGLGRSQIVMYSEEHNQQVQERLTVERLLSKAIEQDLLEIHYQPIVSLTDKKIKGIEALLRLKDEQGKSISPAVFIPIAEDSGSIVPIGEWVIQQSCKQLAKWQEHLDRELYVSINISTRQFQAKSFYPTLEKSISDADLSANSIMIEITESLLLHDNQNNLKLFNQLKTLGCQIAIDDFGTGYSALSYLMKFPLNVLKIDRSFITEHSDQGPQHGLIEAIIQMAHSMNLKVIAEGIETKQQLELMKQFGSEVSIQGYYFAKPMKSDRLEQHFAKLNSDLKDL